MTWCIISSVVYFERIFIIFVFLIGCTIQKEAPKLNRPNVRQIFYTDASSSLEPDSAVLEHLENNSFELTIINNKEKPLSVYSVDFTEIDRLKFENITTLKGVLLERVTKEYQKIYINQPIEAIVIVSEQQIEKDTFFINDYNAIFIEPQNSSKFLKLNHNTVSKLPFHILFITSKTFDGDLGGINGANEKCTSIAKDKYKYFHWKALIAENSSLPFEKIKLRGPIFNTRRKRIASNTISFFEQELISQIYDEDGNFISHEVWTGLTRHGTLSNLNCENWSSSHVSTYGTFGNTLYLSIDHPISSWLGGESSSCSEKKSIYCISE